MRELPILLNGDMVRATMVGTKTMTRRPITKHTPELVTSLRDPDLSWWRVQTDKHSYMSLMGNATPEEQLEFCKDVAKTFNPFGAPGDLLYVRETCRAEELESGRDGVRYLADNTFIEIENSTEASDHWLEMWAYRHGEGLTVPSIHMPKWATRTWLRNTGVKVERVQDISEDDADAEGFAGDIPSRWLPDIFWRRAEDGGDYYGQFSIPQCYGILWDSIYAKRSLGWDVNPWVWATSYEVIER